MNNRKDTKVKRISEIVEKLRKAHEGIRKSQISIKNAEPWVNYYGNLSAARNTVSFTIVELTDIMAEIEGV